MCTCQSFEITPYDVENCKWNVEMCDNVMECPCCCFFLDKRNTTDVQNLINKIDLMPEEITQLKIQIFPSPANKHYYSFNGIEEAVYNLFKGCNSRIKKALERGLSVLKVYYTKDPLFTIPMIHVEILFLYEIQNDIIQELWKQIKVDMSFYTGLVGSINTIPLEDDIFVFNQILSIPLLLGQPEFKKEGALLKHDFSSKQIMEMNYIHGFGIVELEMFNIFDNRGLNLFGELRLSMLNEIKSQKDKLVADIDKLLEKGNRLEEDIANDLPF
jgi:hypothetical protein